MHRIKYTRLLGNVRYYCAQSYDAIVLGGGVSGTSTLYHLAKKGINNTILLEKNKLTSGTTWHSAGLFWNCRSNYRDIELALNTKKIISHLESDINIDVGWKNNGGLFLATNEDRLSEYKRMHTLCKYYGIESYILNKQDIKDLCPLINNDDLVGGLYCKDDGTIEPDGITQAFAKGSNKLGAKIVENCNVTRIISENNKIMGVETDKDIYKSNIVINCAGVWSNQLCEKIGINIPLQPMKHAYILTDEIDGVDKMPNIRDHDKSTYFKIQGKKLAIGGYESNPLLWKPTDFPFSLFDLDMDIFIKHIENHTYRFPIINETGIISTICGPESFTPDHRALIGESSIINGLYFNCGHNSMGITNSSGFGYEIADLIYNKPSNSIFNYEITNSKYNKPGNSIFNYDIKRFPNDILNNLDWIRESSIESYAKNYEVVWPHDEHFSGRNLIKDSLYETLLKKGCIYGNSGGFEIPLYYSGNKINCETGHNSEYYNQISKYYTFGWAKNFNIIQKEHFNCRNNTVLFNQSSFGKFIISGEQSKELLDTLCTNNIKSKIGTTTYTLMCNESGGIEADITVNCIDDNKYYILISGAFREYGYNWFNKYINKLSLDCKIKDITTNNGVISIMGKNSKKILNSIIDEDINLKFSKNKEISINDIDIRVIRLSYVGELGYELHIPMNKCNEIYNILKLYGNKYKLSDAGYNAMESLSMEKGYKHWNSDITSNDTPIEAGLDFLCKDKPFLGYLNINKQIEKGINKKLICLTIDDNIPLYGNEIIYRNSECVGFIRRASYSQYIDKSYGYGYIKSNDYITLDYINNGVYELESLGKRYKATIQNGCIFDPKNKRMKGIY